MVNSRRWHFSGADQVNFAGKKGEPLGSDWSLYGTVNRALWVVAILLPIFLLFSYPSERAARDEAKTDTNIRAETELRVRAEIAELIPQ
jgi:hypothetical protein